MTLVELGEDLRLAGLDEEYRNGDTFALIRAIGISYQAASCDGKEVDFPQWVKDIIGQAMYNLWRTVDAESANSSTSEVNQRFKSARMRAIKALSLSSEGRGSILRHETRRRDALLAEIMRELLTFDHVSQTFKGVEEAKRQILEAFSDTQANTPLGRKLRKKRVEVVGEDALDKAWKKHRPALLQDEIEGEMVSRAAQLDDGV